MEHIWVKPLTEDEFDLPFGATILQRLRNQIKIRDDLDKMKYILYSDVWRPMHPSSVSDVDDMIKLGDLQECAILRNLLLRYKKNLIYTYAGNVLIAVNPYQTLPIYGNETIRMYQNKNLGVLPPHLFAIGDASYQNMMNKKGKQCIIISGESGAGKTQSAKLLLQYYAALAGEDSPTEEKILKSNPILEAFGNAKTVRNDNSSRFGKYISINFNNGGNMEHAEIQHFLLEKSRVVTPCRGEKNYHVFYILMKGLSVEEKKLLGLKEISFYKYLTQYDPTPYESHEIIDFNEFRKALKTLNFTDVDTWKIFELLASILHFGNIEYNDIQNYGVDTVEVVNTGELNMISSLMGVPTHYLKSCLTKKTIVTQTDKVLKELNRQEAVDTRDAFVKAIYDNLFGFIVETINKVIRKKMTNPNGYIGVLDVFGFEKFESNSFEQFCINLANEHLQQFFIKNTFKLEQGLYIEEGIQWKNIPFVDNKEIIDMISGAPLSIISIINDESKFPSSTDETLLSKLVNEHGENRFFLRPKFNNIQVFGIEHFAGVVLYDVHKFLEKNRDSYSDDFRNLARLSGNNFLRRIFSADLEAQSSKGKNRMRTSALKFKSSLDALMLELNQCQPFFIRCIKPNETKSPNLFDRRLCCQQLRYSGVWETSKIRQAGYSVRYSYREFVGRYRILEPRIPTINDLTNEELQEATAIICERIFEKRLSHQFGYTKVFLKNDEYLELEHRRNNMLSFYVIRIQTAVRKMLCRKRYLAMKAGAIVIQKHWRGRKPRLEYQLIRTGIARLQAAINSKFRRVLYLHLRHVIIRLQARFRGFIARKAFSEELRKKRMAAVAIEPRPIFHRPPPTNFVKDWKPTRLQSFLHGRTGHAPDDNGRIYRFVDDSFNFLSYHGS